MYRTQHGSSETSTMPRSLIRTTSISLNLVQMRQVMGPDWGGLMSYQMDDVVDHRWAL
jgi:hypothetical protein